MGKPNLAEMKKKAIADIANSKNFILIAIEEKEVHRHLVIDNPTSVLVALRCMKELEIGMLMPPQPSNIIKT